MASAPKQSAEISILTLDYAALLQSLCAINRPNVNDVTAIFREFRRSLDVRKPKSSSKPSTSPSPSSGASKKRGVKSAASTSAESDGADFDGCGSGDSHEGFERFCTWEPEVKPCWITSDLDLWNRILARNCIELREHKWGEFSLKGYQWPEQKPALRDMLRASLLIHILLRQHRCVTHIFLDMSVTTIERYILWHAIKTGAGGVTRFDCRPSFTDIGSLNLTGCSGSRGLVKGYKMALPFQVPRAATSTTHSWECSTEVRRRLWTRCDAAKPESFGFSTNLRPGDEAVATCLLRKTSPAQTAELAWLRDGRPVTTSADRRVVVIKASQNSLTLAINDVLVEDVGNYSCVADSAAGRFETTVPLLLHVCENNMAP
nr:uncharacterized protein LOC119164681 [Rhipicephalus microplus]